jgi:predicted nuclease of predicted toxin-antitoxin system
MHIKVDEDLPRAIAEVLRQEGYSCSTVLEQEMGGWADADLWKAVQDHKQFLITADKASETSGAIRQVLITASCCCDPQRMESVLL